ncbi:MAG: FAD:protein FMN transferase, partial [Solirubrobacterales bacterium]
CFGGLVTVAVLGPESMRPERAVAEAEATLLEAHRQLSRFLPDSALSRLNRDRRATVPAPPLLIELAAAAREAGRLTDGLVDATLLRQIEVAGYRDWMGGRPAAVEEAPEPTRRAAAPSSARAWQEIAVDRRAGTITRPPGVAIDSGGIAKGLLADLVATTLEPFPAYLVDCCGDLRLGGTAGRPRPIRVEDPFGGEPIHTLRVSAGGVATSGITHRQWRGDGGSPAHHLLDPATGTPAFTGIVQATALAPTAFLADVFAKWALLSGPERAASRLPHGGVLVHRGGEVGIVPARQPEASAA